MHVCNAVALTIGPVVRISKPCTQRAQVRGKTPDERKGKQTCNLM